MEVDYKHLSPKYVVSRGSTVSHIYDKHADERAVCNYDLTRFEFMPAIKILTCKKCIKVYEKIVDGTYHFDQPVRY